MFRASERQRSHPFIDDEGVGHLPVLSHGRIVRWALVDGDVFRRLAQHRWHLRPDGYVFRIDKTGLRYLHREALGLGPGRTPRVWIRGEDKSDCRRSNLALPLASLLELLKSNPTLESQLVAMVAEPRSAA